MNHRFAAWLTIPAMLLAGHATAQDDGTDATETPAYGDVWDAWSPTWSDPQIAKAAENFIGAWKTTQAVYEFGLDAEGSVEMLMTVSPAPVWGVADALYVEQYRADAPGRPFRQSVMQFYRFRDNLRLRTYEILRDEDGKGVLVGMGHLPEAFPTLRREELIATLDLDIESSTGGFKGRTPYAYPTGAGGAVEMTSEIALSGDTLRTADRGYAADGSIAWGAGDDASYEWKRTEAWSTVERRPGGLAIINLATPEGEKPVDGGRVYVHYVGWTADGNKFDASRDKGQPWPLTWPIEQMRVIEGWKQGLGGIADGTILKLIIPPALAYGEQGVPRAGIGPNATLYFDVEVVAVQAPPPAPDQAD